MKPCPAFPSIDISPYPLHDKDGYLEFVTGMWLHTRAISGPPCALEVFLTLTGHFPEDRIDLVIDWMRAHGQLMAEADLIAALRPETIFGRPINWAERIAA